MGWYVLNIQATFLDCVFFQSVTSAWNKIENIGYLQVLIQVPKRCKMQISDFYIWQLYAYSVVLNLVGWTCLCSHQNWESNLHFHHLVYKVHINKFIMCVTFSSWVKQKWERTQLFINDCKNWVFLVPARSSSFMNLLHIIYTEAFQTQLYSR